MSAQHIRSSFLTKMQALNARIEKALLKAVKGAVSWVKRNLLSIVTAVVLIFCMTYVISNTLSWFQGDVTVSQPVEQVEKVTPNSSKIENGVTVKSQSDREGISVTMVVTGVLLFALAVASIFGKAGAPGKIALGVILALIIGHFFFEFTFKEDSPTVAKEWRKGFVAVAKGETPSKPTSASQAEPIAKQERLQTIVKHASWNQKNDAGSLPVDVWSETKEMPPGYMLTFAAGCGVIYVAQYHYLDQEGKENWKDITCGTRPRLSHFRLKVLREGETKLPYTLERVS